MPAHGWNVDVPEAEYYGPIPDKWTDRVRKRDIHSILTELEYAPEIALDTETTGLVVWKDIPLYFSLAWGNRRATLHASMLPHLVRVFKDPYKRWIYANAKYDGHILANVGINLAGKMVDMQVEHALLYEEMPHNLKEVARTILGWRWMDFQDTFGRITKDFPPAELIAKAERENFPLLIEYAANDAWGTLNCHNKLVTQLKDAYTFSLFNNIRPFINTLHDYFEKVEVPYTKTLWKNERNGILVNLPYLNQCEPVAKAEIDAIERDFCHKAGRIINLDSTPALRELFINQLGMTALKQTSGGKSGIRLPSVDAAFFEHLAEKNITGHERNASQLYQAREYAQLILKHRDYSKLYGTYIIGLASKVDPNGRIHTRYNQDVARTGRLSSSDPNLQNIPTVENDKWNLRGAFIAPPGHKLVVADYEQLEMRLLACASREKSMVDIFLRGWDIHMGNAAMVFGLPYDDIKQAKKIKKQVDEGQLPKESLTQYLIDCLARRQDAKAIGFGLNYGMGANKLANSLNCTVQEALDKIEQYMNTYPAVRKFYAEAIEKAKSTGYAYTIAGRRRAVPEINSSRKVDRSRAERVAVNLEIQGSAADVVKFAQVQLDREDLERKFNCISLLQVHDELVHQVPDENVDRCMYEIKDTMEHPFCIDLDVPLAVSIGSGLSWGQAK